MPDRFGRYELLSLVGTGGMAELYRARLGTPAGGEKILAIKRILPRFSADPEFIRLFVNEAKIGLPLTHGNITSVFEFGEVDGRYFLAMEFIHGQNLERVLARAREMRTPLPSELAIFIAGEVAKGLAYAHDFTTPSGELSAVIHQDVSPENVLISYDGAVKLTDFGIARVKAAEIGNGVLRGKANYLAPEQLARADVDERTDLFALGGVLYEMLTGTRAFAAPDERGVLLRIQQGHHAPLAEFDPGLAVLDPLLDSLLAVDPRARPRSAEDVLRALGKIAFERGHVADRGNLAAWMRERFDYELYEEHLDRDGQAGIRDRLLFQLARAQQPIGSSAESTRELLKLSTVPIKTPDDTRTAAHPAERRWPRALAALVAALAFAGAASFVFGKHQAETAPKPTPAATDGGFLSISSWPSAAVKLDGKLLPTRTPIMRLEVAPGPHQLEFVRTDFETRSIELEIAPGEVRTVAVKLER